MTENEIIDFLEDEINGLKEQKYGDLGEIAAEVFKEINGDERIKVFRMAISALKEVQRYRKIGTVEECRKAVEKQKVKELVYESDSVFSNGFSHYRMGKCPMCDRYYNSSDEVNYCSKCGQALMNENLEGMEDE